MKIFMEDSVKLELKLNKVIKKLWEKLGLNYKILRITGGFKIFTIKNEPIAYASLVDKNFELFANFNKQPRQIRRMLLDDLRYITLFNASLDEIEKRFA